VLRDGATVSTRRNEGISEDAIIRDMVGRDLTHLYPDRLSRPGPVLMEVRDWNVWHPEHADRQVIRDVDFTVRQGEIVGIAGLMGSGRTELAMSLFGRSYGRNVSGSVSIGGRPADVSTVRAAIASGLAYVTEDRKALGLLLEEPVLRNISLANLPGVSTRGIIDKAEEQGVAQRYRTAMNIRTPTVHQRVVNLSGGNQQKVVLSKWLFADPQVLILDEPTRGIDVGAKYEIYTIMDRLAAEGHGVVMISSEMPELLGMCDRIYVMKEGRLVGELDRAEATQERVMALILQN
jgi:putative multiple sugar transport system ATP-binding protein